MEAGSKSSGNPYHRPPAQHRGSGRSLSPAVAWLLSADGASFLSCALFPFVPLSESDSVHSCTQLYHSPAVRQHRGVHGQAVPVFPAMLAMHERCSVPSPPSLCAPSPPGAPGAAPRRAPGWLWLLQVPPPAGRPHRPLLCSPPRLGSSSQTQGGGKEKKEK